MLNTVNGLHNLELDAGLHLGHDLGRLLELLGFGLSQDLLDHVGHAVAAKDTWQRQVHLFADSVLALLKEIELH